MGEVPTNEQDTSMTQAKLPEPAKTVLHRSATPVGLAEIAVGVNPEPIDMRSQQATQKGIQDRQLVRNMKNESLAQEAAKTISEIAGVNKPPMEIRGPGEQKKTS